MADEHLIARCRNLYRKLLGFYPRPYREKFGESMEQTFSDLCRERSEARKGILGFALWLFVETLAAIIRENVTYMFERSKNIIRIAIVTACILMVPLLAGAPWSRFDFVFAGMLLFGTGLTYELVAKRRGTIAYRAAVGVACATALILTWINAAVGIIGDGPVNMLYLGVVAVGFVGAFIARFDARGMAIAMFATAVSQMIVPVVALVIWKAGSPDLLIDPTSPHSPFHPGIVPVFVLNGVFAAFWVASALLFRRAESQDGSLFNRSAAS